MTSCLHVAMNKAQAGCMFTVHNHIQIRLNIELIAYPTCNIYLEIFILYCLRLKFWKFVFSVVVPNFWSRGTSRKKVLVLVLTKKSWEFTSLWWFWVIAGTKNDKVLRCREPHSPHTASLCHQQRKQPCHWRTLSAHNLCMCSSYLTAPRLALRNVYSQEQQAVCLFEVVVWERLLPILHVSTCGTCSQLWGSVHQAS